MKATPQQNHMAEIGFTVLVARASMNRANFSTNVRYRLFGEVANTVCKLDWLSVIELKGEKKEQS